MADSIKLSGARASRLAGYVVLSDSPAGSNRAEPLMKLRPLGRTRKVFATLLVLLAVQCAEGARAADAETTAVGLDEATSAHQLSQFQKAQVALVEFESDRSVRVSACGGLKRRNPRVHTCRETSATHRQRCSSSREGVRNPRNRPGWIHHRGVANRESRGARPGRALRCAQGRLRGNKLNDDRVGDR